MIHIYSIHGFPKMGNGETENHPKLLILKREVNGFGVLLV
jgi:hypothetical protein